MGLPPCVLSGPVSVLRVRSIPPDPVVHDAGEHEHHADQDDQMGGVLGDRERADGPLPSVIDEAVLDDVEQEAERHDSEAELCRPRQRSIIAADMRTVRHRHLVL
jgi:hypothetical protein